MSPSTPRWRRWWAVPVVLLPLSGCHQIVIDSGLQPAAEVYHEEWNIAFANAIFPAQVDASEWCEGRFSRVETKQSFLNGVVAAVTSGIISPMDVRVVCATSESGDGAGPVESPDPSIPPR